MKTFQSEIYGSMPQPDSFEELVNLVARMGTPKRTVRIWRGQGFVGWPIHSTAHRRLSLDCNEVTEEVMQSYESALLEYAIHKGFQCDHTRTLSDLELLAKLRHHGAATRLVDATRNVMVALWFCVSDEVDRVGLLLGIHTNYLGGYEGQPETRTYKDIFDNLGQLDHPQTWEPPVVTARIAAQHSQFLYSHACNDPRGSLKLPEGEDAVLALAITPALKVTLQKILNGLFDIRHMTLFPDIDGFGYANSHRFSRWDYHRW